MELSAAVQADLAFHRSKWFVPVGRTLHCYQDGTVAMAYHGAVYLTDRHSLCRGAPTRTPHRIFPALLYM